MLVLGKHCFVFDGITNKTCEVLLYDPTIGRATQVPIVDAAIAYDCPYTHKTYILMARNALYVPTLTNNLIPPFIMREAGLEVNDKPKIHCDDPSIEDHSIYCHDADLRIPLQLHGIFSYFHTRMPTSEELQSCDKMLITPDSITWDPYSTHFANNEDSMTDWEGNMYDKHDRKRRTIDIAPNAVSLDHYEASIDSVVANSPLEDLVDPMLKLSLESQAQIDSHDFAYALSEQAEVSAAKISIGSTVSTCDDYDDLWEPFERPYFSSIDELEDLFEADKVAEIKAVMKHPKAVSAETLSKIWSIDNATAKAVIEQNTQLLRQNADNDLSRHFSTNDRMLRYRRIDSQFYTDTLLTKGANGTSSRGNTYCQVFVSDKGYIAVYPMKKRSDFKDALHQFCKEVGVPSDLVMDPSGEQTKKEVKRFLHQVGTTPRYLEESTQWANRAELYIGLLKEAVRKDMRLSDAPMKFWDYCIERRARIHNLTPRSLLQLNGNTPQVATFGVPGDISNLCQFGWYDWCYFREESKHGFPEQKLYLGRVLGPIKNEGNEMCQAVLKSTGIVRPRRTIRPLNTSELYSPTEKEKRRIFDEAIRSKHGDSTSYIVAETEEPKPVFDVEDFLCDEDLAQPEKQPEEDPVDATGRAINEKPFSDYLIHAEVLLPQGEEMKSAKVVGRSKDSEGKVLGEFDANPLLNSIIYDVEFPDGAIKQYAANVIAENMFSQIDEYGHNYLLLDHIIDYSKDGHAVDKADKYVYTKSGQRRMRKTTQGWKLLVQWKDGSESWMPLQLLKQSNPVEVAEFARAHNIDDEPAFSWWVPFTLKQRDRIISAVNSRVRKSTHKYGIEVPTSVEHAREIDLKNGNTLWSDAIELEMKNVAVAFEILETGEPIPVGWTKSSGHIVFDVKMDFTRKARWVKDGHRTPEPDNCTFAGVVSRESVRIALTYAALNGIDVWTCDIMNAYLQAPSSEKHYVICGLEFGIENLGKVALIRRALYGGKASGADFWKHLRSYMFHLGFQSCHADPEVWMREAEKDDGTPYWEYVLIHTDDCLVISNDGENLIRTQIGKCFVVKEKSIGPPDIYLGNKVSHVELMNGVKAWSFSSAQYVKASVDKITEYLKTLNQSLPTKATTPIKADYRPEIDISPELNARDAAHYQSLIGILRWIVELGRMDICVEASMMASCMALPRQGHLEQVYHIFAYLKYHHNAELVFDPSEPDIPYEKFEKQEWGHTVYGDAKEDLPHNAKEPRGFGFKIRAYVDSDHAGDSKTRRSRTGYMVFLNNALIYWMSKKQTSIETSTFGSEFIAMKTCCEYLKGLRYKLRMMGIPVDFPCYI